MELLCKGGDVMKLLCKCGNIFDFASGDGSMDDGFEIAYDMETEEISIRCNHCDSSVLLFDPITVDK